MRDVTIAGDETMPALRLGTWMMGERPECRAEEIAALAGDA